jgi:hypothetical protein
MEFEGEEEVWQAAMAIGAARRSRARRYFMENSCC